MRIISEKGKGQLIFTSHNLRPLETIDRGFIVFTTTNADKRYIRFNNVKTNHNLRDFYYRDIVLGEQSEGVSDAEALDAVISRMFDKIPTEGTQLIRYPCQFQARCFIKIEESFRRTFKIITDIKE